MIEYHFVEIDVYVIAHAISLVSLVITAVLAVRDYLRTREDRHALTSIVFTSFAMAELFLIIFAVEMRHPFVFEPHPWFKPNLWLITAVMVFFSATSFAFLAVYLMDLKEMYLVPPTVFLVTVAYLLLIDNLIRSLFPGTSIITAPLDAKQVIREVLVATTTIYLIFGLLGTFTLLYIYSKVPSLKILAFSMAVSLMGFINVALYVFLGLIPSLLENRLAPTTKLYLDLITGIPVNVVYAAASIILVLAYTGVLERLLTKRGTKILEDSWVGKAIEELE